MSDLRVGRIIRAVRLERRLLQSDVSKLSGVDRSVMSDLEHGRLEAVTLRTARRACAPMGIELVVEARWRGGAVDRLLDRGHAAIVEAVVRGLVRNGWVADVEYTFNEYGDRGSVDVLAWHEQRQALLIVEVKTTLMDLQATLMSLSKKVRVVPGLVARQRGWDRRHLGYALVVAGTTGNRSIVDRHASLFSASFRDRSLTTRAWIRDPDRDLAGLWLVSPVAVRRPKRARRSLGEPD